MDILCPECGSRNSEAAQFCYRCGAALSDTPPPSGTSSASLAARLKKWLRISIGCFSLGVLLAAALMVLYYYWLRPVIQRELLDQIEMEARSALSLQRYEGALRNAVISELSVNDALDDVWDKIPGIQNGKVDLRQDEIVITLIATNLDFRLAIDMRVNKEGELITKSLDMNWPFYLLFTEDELRTFIDNFVNTQILRPANLSLRAFQVAENEIFLAYEAR